MKTQSIAGFKGVYEFEHWRAGQLLRKWEDHNLIPTEGLNTILGVHVHADAQQTAWYVGLGSGNYTVDASDTAANIASRVTEITAYSGNRPQVTFAAPSAGSTSNAAAKATFTLTGTVATVTNAFVVSTATGSGGKILSSLKLNPARTGFISGDQIVVTFTLSATSA